MTNNKKIEEIEKLSNLLMVEASANEPIIKEAQWWKGIATRVVNSLFGDAAEKGAIQAARTAAEAAAKGAAGQGAKAAEKAAIRAAKQAAGKSLRRDLANDVISPQDFYNLVRYDPKTGIATPLKQLSRDQEKQVAAYIGKVIKPSINIGTRSGTRAAKKAVSDLAKSSARIQAMVNGMSLGAKAKKGAKTLGILGALYYMLSGSKPSSSDPQSQQIISGALAGDAKPSESNIRIDIINNKIDELISELNALSLDQKYKKPIQAHVQKLSGIKQSLEKCAAPLNTNNMSSFTGSLKQAEDKINAYLPHIDKLIDFLSKLKNNSGLADTAEEVAESLEDYVDAVNVSRNEIGVAS